MHLCNYQKPKKNQEKSETFPGFTDATFTEKANTAKPNGKDIICSLLFDEMSIRKHIQWDGKRFTGFIEYGTGLIDDSMPPATEAQSSWLYLLIPVGRFLMIISLQMD